MQKYKDATYSINMGEARTRAKLEEKVERQEGEIQMLKMQYEQLTEMLRQRFDEESNDRHKE